MTEQLCSRPLAAIICRSSQEQNSLHLQVQFATH